ncbi:MAG: FHA domain-containing protein [bacterium]|nr:FHA domain-containing protein [bacterium]
MEKIIVKSGKEIIQILNLDKEIITLGADPSNDVVLDHLLIAPFHAKIRKTDDGFIFEDLDTENGCYMQGNKIMKHLLSNNDEVEIANFVIVFSEAAGYDDETETSIITAFEKEDITKLGKPYLLSRNPGSEGKRYPIEKLNVTVGRSQGADIIVVDTTVSRKHAQIEYKDGHYILTDLNSSNGTFVNGEKIEIKIINFGDLVQFGEMKFVFSGELES